MPKKKVAPLQDIKYTARTLRALAYDYLRYERLCYAVAFERSPLGGKPDVLGLDNRRQLHEIEIKISKADFDRDAKKPHRAKLMHTLERAYPNVPATLSYLVPPKLVNHVLENAPPYAGVMTPNAIKLNAYTGMSTLSVLRKPTKLHDQRLSIRNCIMMMRDVSGTLASLLRDDVRHQAQKTRLESQITALGGVVEKPKRKKRKKSEVKAIDKGMKKSARVKKANNRQSRKGKRNKKVTRRL